MQRRILSYGLVAILTMLLTTWLQPLSALQTMAQSGCQTFKETGKTVCGRFLQYWQQNGGLAQQGFPLSNEFQEVNDLDGKSYTVQYFERAVFEKHPENQPPYDVLLSQLGTFRFKAKYPNGDPSVGGQPTVPTSTPKPAPPAPAARLEVKSYHTYTNAINDTRLAGFAVNTGNVQLGEATIVVLLKDSGGKIVGSETERTPTGLMPGDFYPFVVEFDTAIDFASVEFQINAPEATQRDRDGSYRDFQVTDVNILPDSMFGGISVVGNVKNTGGDKATFTHVYAAVLDSAGNIIDAGDSYAAFRDLNAGQSSAFKVEFEGGKGAVSAKVAVYADR